MTAHLSASLSPTTRARLAHLMGFPPAESPRRSADADDDEWYIPYNGPIEPPRAEDAPRARARAPSTATRKSYASSQFTRSFYGGGGIGEAPVHTAASARDRMSTYSTYSRDGEWEREGEREREHRGSIASFLTFGQSPRRDRDAGFVFPRPRRSGEARIEELSPPPPQRQMQPRAAALSLTAADRGRTARDSMEVSVPLRASVSQGHHAQREWFDTDEPEEDTSWEEQQQTIPRSISQPVVRHPYAVAFPQITHDPPPPARLLSPPGPAPTHTASNSRSTTATTTTTTSSKPSSKPSPMLHFRPAPSPSAPAPARTLRPSALSTPNLRAGARKTQYAAETWCDALMFPRPRFRAHVVSPPVTPEDDKPPGHARALRRAASARVLLRQDYFEPREKERAHSHTQYPPAPAPQNPPLSPTSDALERVLAAGAQRAHEREAWRAVASTSFQNGRSRSLSTRSRKKSGMRVRVDSERGLAAEIAAEAFRQPTPTISVSVSASGSGRPSGSAAHSRNTSASVSGHGHGHSGHGHGHSNGGNGNGPASWALKMCEGEASPEEAKLVGALRSGGTARLSVRGRREEEAARDAARDAVGRVVDIAPVRVPVRGEGYVDQRGTSYVDQRGTSYADTRGTSYAADTRGTSYLDARGPSYATTTREHSYASDSLDVPLVGIALSTPPPMEDVPDLSAHPYARPHPTTARDYDYAGPHPTARDYDYAGPHPTARDYPRAAWERVRGEGSPSAYAYADVEASDKRESTLGVEEVLMSRTFLRGAESVFDAYDDEPPPRQATPPPPARVRRKPPPLPDAPGTPRTASAPDAAAAGPSTALSSPTSQTSGSDDLAPFRDLFYKPGGTDSAPPTREASGSWSAERIRSNEGLRALARRRPSYEAALVHGQSPAEEAYGPQLDGMQEMQLGPSASPLPGLDGGALHLATPLRAEYAEEEGPRFPEDIESSRASSVIEPAPSLHSDSHEDTLRLGSVALAVAQPTQTERRQSTALSFGDTEDDGASSSVRAKRDTVATTVTASSSLGVPATVEDLLRTSFVTSTSSTSRMSNLLGDFPVPPLEGITPPSATVLQSYFAQSAAGDSRIHSHASDAISE